jgi:hypothetical protein
MAGIFLGKSKILLLIKHPLDLLLIGGNITRDF